MIGGAAWGLDDDGRTGQRDNLGQQLGRHLPLSEIGVSVPARIEGVAGIVAVNEIDPARGLQHPADEFISRLAARPGVASVKDKTGIQVSNHLPEPGNRFDSSGDRVVATGGVLDQDGNLGFQLQQRFSPARIGIRQRTIPGEMAAMNNYSGGADFDRRFARLGQDAPRGNPDTRGFGHDVDQVGSMDVDRERVLTKLGGVGPGVGLLPALGITKEDLDDVGLPGGCLTEGVLAIDVSPYQEPIGSHVVIA